MESISVGLIGVGVMGFTVAARLLGAGHRLTVYDVAGAAAEKAAELGAAAAESPAEAAAKSSIVLLFLPGPKEVTECVASPNGVLSASRPGTVVVDMGTTDPGTSQRMAQLAATKQVGYLDAPVLGRPATVGRWALPVGGEKNHLEQCRPIFEIIAANIFHVGPVGTGHKIKLLNQLMFGAINAMTAEMMAISEKMGIPPRLLYETITASQAGTVSNLFRELGERIALENYADPTFTVDLLAKDILLAVQMAKEYNAPPIVARCVELVNELAQAQGLGKMDTSAMWKSYRKIWQED